MWAVVFVPFLSQVSFWHSGLAVDILGKFRDATIIHFSIAYEFSSFSSCRFLMSHLKPFSCFLRYSLWSKKSLSCGISIFCPFVLSPPEIGWKTLLLIVRCGFLEVELLWFAMLDSILVGSDNPRIFFCDSIDIFSVINSGEELLLWKSFVDNETANVVDFAVSSVVNLFDKRANPAKTVVELVNEELLESVMG